MHRRGQQSLSSLHISLLPWRAVADQSLILLDCSRSHTCSCLRFSLLSSRRWSSSSRVVCQSPTTRSVVRASPHASQQRGLVWCAAPNRLTLPSLPPILSTDDDRASQVQRCYHVPTTPDCCLGAHRGRDGKLEGEGGLGLLEKAGLVPALVPFFCARCNMLHRTTTSANV